MNKLLAAIAVSAVLLGAGGTQPPYPSGAPTKAGGQGAAGPTGATGATGATGPSPLVDGGLSVPGIVLADGGIVIGPGTSICLDGNTCSDSLTILGGFVRVPNNLLVGGITAQGSGIGTNSGGHLSDNGHTVPPVIWLNVDAGSSTASHMEIGACTASSNACPSQTLHFSAVPYCVCSDNASTLGACSVTSVTAIAVVPKTFGATDVATWMCFGAN
jgi:hypothetical protein